MTKNKPKMSTHIVANSAPSGEGFAIEKRKGIPQCEPILVPQCVPILVSQNLAARSVFGESLFRFLGFKLCGVWCRFGPGVVQIAGSAVRFSGAGGGSIA